MKKIFLAPTPYYENMKVYKQWLADEENNILHMTVKEWVHQLGLDIANSTTDYAVFSMRCCKGVEMEINGYLIPVYKWHEYKNVMCHVRNADLTTMKIASD